MKTELQEIRELVAGMITDAENVPSNFKGYKVLALSPTMMIKRVEEVTERLDKLLGKN